MRLKFAVVSVVAVALILGVSSCGTPRANFDAWTTRQGFTVKHEPVPCTIFPRNCGGMGQTDIVNKIIYLDDARIAATQARQNGRDPSIDVATFMYYHEWSHVADYKAGFVEGIGDLQFEHAANCGMELLLGRTYDFFQPGIYWDCPDSELARTRWLWTAFRIIA
jgi:hypothetical protein